MFNVRLQVYKNSYRAWNFKVEVMTIEIRELIEEVCHALNSWLDKELVMWNQR